MGAYRFSGMWRFWGRGVRSISERAPPPPWVPYMENKAPVSREPQRRLPASTTPPSCTPKRSSWILQGASHKSHVLSYCVPRRPSWVPYMETKVPLSREPQRRLPDPFPPQVQCWPGARPKALRVFNLARPLRPTLNLGCGGWGEALSI